MPLQCGPIDGLLEGADRTLTGDALARAQEPARPGLTSGCPQRFPVMAAEAHKGARCSVEGLARAILVGAARSRGPGLGSLLAAIGRQYQASLAAAGESRGDREIDAVFSRSGEQNEPE